MGSDVVVVDRQSLSTTARSVAFASWIKPLGQLQFVSPDDPETFSYFVPRIIRSLPLQKYSNREKDRSFP